MRRLSATAAAIIVAEFVARFRVHFAETQGHSDRQQVNENKFNFDRSRPRYRQNRGFETYSGI